MSYAQHANDAEMSKMHEDDAHDDNLIALETFN